MRRTIGEGVLAVLQSPQPPPTEAILTALLNEIATLPDPFVLVLDDYHVIDAQPVDQALTFLLEHLPPQMHLVIATREDPPLPLARLRARDQLTELRAADLRFTPAEAAGFLNQVMGLNLSADDIAALETRTEGWIAGLQLAALSMQGHHDTSRLHPVVHRQPPFRAGLSGRRSAATAARTASRRSCCAPRSSTACAARCVMPCCATRRLPGKRPWNISSAPTCSSSPWTTSGAGIAITISSPICCGSACTRAPPRLPGMRGMAWPNYTAGPASGMRTMAWRSKRFTMRLPPMMLSAPSA